MTGNLPSLHYRRPWDLPPSWGQSNLPIPIWQGLCQLEGGWQLYFNPPTKYGSPENIDPFHRRTTHLPVVHGPCRPQSGGVPQQKGSWSGLLKSQGLLWILSPMLILTSNCLLLNPPACIFFLVRPPFAAETDPTLWRRSATQPMSVCIHRMLCRENHQNHLYVVPRVLKLEWT